MSEKTLSVEELAEALRAHRAEIVEANEWRPLAAHILELLRQGLLPIRAAERTAYEQGRGDGPTTLGEVARRERAAFRRGQERKIAPMQKALEKLTEVTADNLAPVAYAAGYLRAALELEDE